jgi:hypothetical protein
MTVEEFEKEKERVELYDTLSKRKRRLYSERMSISDGVLKIVSAYQREITYKDEYELQKNIIDAICNVYDKEIGNINVEINNL